MHLLAPLISRLDLERESLSRTKDNGEEFYEWGKLEAMLADLIDEIRVLRAIQTAKPRQRPKWDPYPRPKRQERPQTFEEATTGLMKFFGLNL